MTKSDHTGWLALGVRAYDAVSGRVGVVQLVRDDTGTLTAARPAASAWPGRVLLRPLARPEGDLPWWAHAANLRHPDRHF